MSLLLASRLLFATLASALALTIAATPAVAGTPTDVAYYYGSTTIGVVPTDTAAKLIQENILMVVDLGTKQLQAITFMPPPAGSGKAFSYQVDSSPTSLTVENFTSTNAVSYTFLSKTQNTSANGDIAEQQVFLSGANQQIDLGGGNGAASIPSSLQGTLNAISFKSQTASGSAGAAAFHLDLLLPQSKFANGLHKSLADAVTLATDYFNSINGAPAP